MQGAFGDGRFWRIGLVAATLLTASTMNGTARADDKIVCANASENGQKLRDDGKLMKARQEFLVCARDVCPQVIKKDCVDWLQKSETNLPTVVLTAKDSHGQDVMIAHVTFDGAPLADKLDGKAIFVDPGEHTFHFEIPGEKPIDQKLVLHEGEKNRLVSVSLAPEGSPDQGKWQGPGPGPSPGGTTPPPPEPEKPKSKVPALIVGGGGLAIGAAGGVFYLLAYSEYNGLACTGNGTCTDSQKSSVATKADVAYVMWGVGGALVVTGVVLFVLESGGTSSARADVSARSSSFTDALGKIGVTPLPGGGAATFGTTF